MAAGTLGVFDNAGASKTLTAMQDTGNSNALAMGHVVCDGATAANKAAVTASLALVVAPSVAGQYSTGANLFTLPATPTDVVQITGSASKTVRIKRIVISGQATTAKQWPLQIIRRAAAITGGTPVTPVITKHDTNDAAVSAVVTHYTALGSIQAANPASSVMFAHDLTLTAPATAAAPFVWASGTGWDKDIVLRGAADCLVINLGGVALTAGEKLSYMFEWTEDAS
jgi:hypothetical protein